MLAGLSSCTTPQGTNALSEPTDEPELEHIQAADLMDIAVNGTKEEQDQYNYVDVIVTGRVSHAYYKEGSATSDINLLTREADRDINLRFLQNTESMKDVKKGDEVTVKVKVNVAPYAVYCINPELLSVTPLEELDAQDQDTRTDEEKEAYYQKLEDELELVDVLDLEELFLKSKEDVEAQYGGKEVLLKGTVDNVSVTDNLVRISLKTKQTIVWVDIVKTQNVQIDVQEKDEIIAKGTIKINFTPELKNPELIKRIPYEQTEQYQLDQMSEAQRQQELAENTAKFMELIPQYQQETNGLILRFEITPTDGIDMFVTNDWYLKTPQEKDYFAAEYYKKLNVVSMEVFGHAPYLRIYDENGVEVAAYRIFGTGMKIKH